MPYITAEQFERVLTAAFRSTRDNDKLSWYTVHEHFVWSKGAPIVLADLRISLAKSVDHADGNYHTDLEMVFQVDVTVDRYEQTLYFRKTGEYQSFEGSTWDGDFTQVKPAEKVVIDYETVTD
ncbi:hypothetical protein AB0E01_22810 [Nocardia vinacea]|uniref:hypothetical protein n=1 Tax=Nocardia vinacea TaxID=96468 RepID=UPI0033CC9981